MLAACLQMPVEPCGHQENRCRALDMAGRALDRGATIIVFPELFLTGFCYSRPVWDPVPFSSLDELRSLARDRDCMILGSIMSREKDGCYNLGFCLSRGEEDFYRKVHPFCDEKVHFTPGKEIRPLTAGRLKVGLEICYDIRFPEVSRSLCLQGADMLVTIAQFPALRIDQWRHLCLARAIENQIPHIACNWANAGQSMIIDSNGRVLAEAGPGEALISTRIDLSDRDRLRQAMPCLADRRPDIYRGIQKDIAW